MSLAAVQAASRAALAALPHPPDGYCGDAVRMVLRHLADRGVRARVRAYVAPRHPGPHYTVVAGGVEYDPTVGYANWSRCLHVPRSRLYVVTDRSPHRRWSAWTGRQEFSREGV